MDCCIHFGLLHGLGFAGALREVGLPQHAIPVALLFFNIGVELGQLLFIAFVIVTIACVVFAADRLREGTVSAIRRIVSIDSIAAYVIGAVAAYWLIERTSAFFL